MRALALLLLSFSACATPPGTPELFRFLEINDVHILDDASMAYPAKIVDAMNREDAALTLVCGDVASDGKEEELQRAKSVLSRFRMPWFIVPGNHDAQYPGNREEVNFGKVFEMKETTYAFERSGFHFVAIDPGCGSSYKNNAVGAGPLAKLREIAARIPAGAPVILFSHYQYNPGMPGRTPNAEEVLAIFSKQRVLAVVAGHFHGNTMSRQDGILFTTTASASSTRNNHDNTKAKGYRVFTIRNGRDIDTQFKEVAP